MVFRMGVERQCQWQRVFVDATHNEFLRLIYHSHGFLNSKNPKLFAYHDSSGSKHETNYTSHLQI